MYKGKAVMGIRLGKPPVIFKTVAEAQKKTGLNHEDFSEALKGGFEACGWCFDFPININKKSD